MNLIERVKAIILTPKSEWQVIAGESGDTAYLFKNYVAILAAIPAVCGFVGMLLIGLGLGVALTFAIVSYLLSFVAVFVVAFIVDLLATTFDGRKDFESALKVTVYSYTPAWLVGVFLLIPGLGFLRILGLYALYLLWAGLPPLMKSPEGNKTLGYAVTIVVVAIIVYIVIAAILGVIVGLAIM
jgi:dolichyl-phosphate-mannose--protein O-mannosyl transferase